MLSSIILIFIFVDAAFSKFKTIHSLAHVVWKYTLYKLQFRLTLTEKPLSIFPANTLSNALKTNVEQLLLLLVAVVM